MPLRSNLGKSDGKGIRDRKLLPSATGTSKFATPCPAPDLSLPLVIVRIWAFPPDLSARACNDIYWRQCAVLRGMPLGSDRGEERSKGVGNGNLVIRTKRAATFSLPGPTADARFPFVIGALGTLPPNFSI